mgnify:CR=1 FL=1
MMAISATDDGDEAIERGIELDLSEIKKQELEDEDLKEMLKEDTIFYSPLSKTALKSGKLSFLLPDRIGKFRVTVIGITPSGLYGLHSSKIQIQRPFNAILEYPSYIRNNDQIKLNLILQNNTE